MLKADGSPHVVPPALAPTLGPAPPGPQSGRLVQVQALPRPRGRLVMLTCLLLGVALLLRVPYLFALGHGYDLDSYRKWLGAIQTHGLAEVFEQTDTDYVGYHYLLWGIGKAYTQNASDHTIRDRTLRLWLKSPGVAGDIFSIVVVIGLTLHLARAPATPRSGEPVSRLARRLRLDDAEMIALSTGIIWAFHPALLYAGVYWGQNDSLVTAFALAAMWAALARRPALAGVLLATGALLKPQPLIIGPVLAWTVATRCGWRGLLRGGLAGGAMLLIGHLFFVFAGHGDDLVRIYRDAVVVTQRLTYNAYNVWWPLTYRHGPGSAGIACTIGSTQIRWGTLASIAVMGVLVLTAVGLLRRRDGTGALLACGYLIFGFFMVGAGVHERYALPALPFLLVALPLARAWILPTLVLSLTLLVNVALILPFDGLYREGRPIWLTLVVAGVNCAVLLVMTGLMLRGPTALTPPAPAARGGYGPLRKSAEATEDV